ncbi:MAG: nucleoside triphosphate pyrophosphohydrolase [Clostridia bacterium]|nr:nucleoside triphosphate pyrophosphohydrolase [Clostridia bacterium]
MITVVGLGVNVGDLTEQGKQAILAAASAGKPIVCRTAKAKSYANLAALGVAHTSLDSVYESSRSFTTLNKNLANAVHALGNGTVYCVDGAASEDNSVKLLSKKRGGVKIISGVSKISDFAARAAFLGCSYTAVSAYELTERAKAGGLTTPLIVYDVDDRFLASDVKLLLADLFGEETVVQYLYGEKRKKLPLYSLDRQRVYDYTCAVAIDEVDLLKKKRFTLDDLHEIVCRLRAPGGCPWDRAQTPDSIKMNVVEEAYELVDAVDSGDDDKVLEETGDVFLQAVFFAVMKAECGAFTLTDALSGICEKLISRHTHIFGKDKATDAESALSVWDKNKKKEKHHESFADAVNDVPRASPAAMRAQKVGKRAAKSGLDFASVEEALDCLQGEIEEFLAARKQGNKQEIEKELGDVLFSAVNVGRMAGVDCEKALKESTDAFARRFTLAEQLASAACEDITKLSAEEWDGYYRAAKAAIANEDKNV